MLLNINFDKDGNIVSYQGGDPSQNDCPDGCKTISVDDALVKFEPGRMKIKDNQLVMKG